MTRTATIFCAVSWIPVAAWLGAEIYVSQFDGWGQWAAAPIVLIPVLLSVVLVIFGALVRRGIPVESRPHWMFDVCLLLAGLPACWLAVRALFA